MKFFSLSLFQNISHSRKKKNIYFKSNELVVFVLDIFIWIYLMHLFYHEKIK